MPQPLSPEDFDSQFGGGFAAQPPQAGLGTRFGAAIDRAQAGILGVGEAAGLPVGDLRRQNQFEQEQSMSRYFRDNPNEPQSYKDVDSVGSAMRYLRGLGIDASPELVTSLLTGGAGSLAGLGYAGRVGLAAASNYPAALGDILQNQREEAGTTTLGSAAALAVPYAAADLVGLDAAIAGGRMARTGIKRLDEMQGLRGGLARTGANVALNAPVEGISETFQEGVNQLGRMAVNPSQTLFNPEANERYLESFIGGAALGGAASGAMGGWRRSEGYQAPDRETDLTSARVEQEFVPPRPIEGQFITQDQTVGLQSFINQTTGVDRTKRKGYAEQFMAAYDEPSGQFVSDPETGVERQLTAGEVLQRDQAPMDLTQEKPAEAAAASAAVSATVRDPRSYELRDTFGVIPTPSSLQLYTDIQTTGIPVDSDVLMDVWKYAGEKPMTPKRLEKAQQLLDAAIIKSRQEAPSGTGVPSVQQPAGGLGIGSTVVPGVVGAAGPSVAPTGGGVQPAGAAGAPVQQAGVLPVSTPQQTAAVAPTAPETRFRRAPRPMTVLEAANAAKAAQAQQTETQGSQAPAAAGPIVDPRQAMMQRIFGQRNGDIIFDVVGMGMPEPEAAAKYGLSRQAIQKIAGATGADQRAAQIARAKAEQGLTDAQIAEAFSIAPEEELGTEVEREVFGRGQAPGAITETEAIEGGLENIVKTAGAGTAEVEGFTKLDKDIDATLEALAAETDENVIAELMAKMAELTEKAKAVGKRKQAEVRRTAGETTEPTTEGETDAVQVESAAGVPVQSETKAGQGVGRQVRRAEKPAGKGEGKVLTEAEQAAQAWDKVASDYPTAPKFSDLTDEQRQDFIDFGPENWTKDDVETELTKLARTTTPTKRVDYPPTAGQQNAPDYLIPAQRAVVDFMNGDITREDLQQRFAELKMTTGQQRSVTNRIEWYPADFEAVKDIIDGKVRLGPDARMSRGAVEVKYGNSTFKAAKFTLDEMRANNGIRAAFDHYDSEGMSSLYEDIDIWMIADNSVDFDAAVFPQGDKKVMAFRAGVVLGADMDLVTRVTHHEIGHMADDVFHGGGLSSGREAFNVRVINGKIRPMGEVMKEVYDFYNAEPDSEIGKLLRYPFDFNAHGALSSDRLREEVYAQLWAIYVNPELRNDLEDSLPTTFDFMEFEYESAKEAASTATRKANAAATQGQRVQAPAGDLRASRSTSPTKEQVNRTVSKLPKQAQKPVSNSINTIADWARQGLDRVVFTGDLINRAVDAGLTAAKKFEGLLAKRSTKARALEREVERIADMYAVIAEKDKGTGPNSANQFIFDSTRTGKWGYGKYADSAMAARFNALAPKTQEFVKAVFAHGDKMLSAKKATVLKYATSEYDGRIAVEKDPVKKAALLKDKANDLKKFARLFQIREGIPYAPIKRFGAHVVIAKSKAYIDAKAANDTKLLSQLEKDPDHYHVSFTDTKNEARNLVSQLETQGFFADGTVAFKERSTAEKELFGNSDSLGAITRLRAMADAKANAGEKSAAQMQRMISDLYLQALAEGSARKSEMRRRGVAGEVDMLRSFAAQGRADANFIASVEYNPQVQDAIQEMRSQENSGSGDLNRKSELLNELTKRYESSLDVTPTPTLSKITRLSSIYYLATSPAYYLQNLTQPWMMSLPAMSGRHEYTKASGELFKAYGQLSGVMKSAKLFDQQFDFSKVPADVRAAIQELANRGKIDIGMETELGEFKVEGDSAFSKGWNKVDKGMRVAVQKVESINRLSTAMAAYRLELAKTGKVEDAINYADRILTETHGDYTAFNAPRFFNNPVGKIALQFRKFQLIQLTYYAKLINEAFTGTEKKAAIKALTYSLGHTALLAGAMGLPGYSAIAWLIGALFGDDDEPLDVAQELRKWIGDETTANLVMRGAPTLAGMDISGKVGAGNMLSIMPFSQADLTTRAGVIEAAGTLLGGAPVGMAARVADGLGLMLGGNWYKGMEQILPKGLGDAAKAYRIATEGMTRRNGDIVLPASEVSAAEAIMQAIGIQPVQQSVIMERQQATREMDQSFQDRSTRVKADYIKAVRAGESTTEARAAWTKLQEARVANGYTRQPLSELLKAPQNQAKRERQVIGGVQFNKANKRFVEEQV